MVPCTAQYRRYCELVQHQSRPILSGGEPPNTVTSEPFQQWQDSLWKALLELQPDNCRTELLQPFFAWFCLTICLHFLPNSHSIPPAVLSNAISNTWDELRRADGRPLAPSLPPGPFQCFMREVVRIVCDSGAEAEWLAFGVCLAAKVAAADNVPSGEGLLPAPKAPSDGAREANPVTFRRSQLRFINPFLERNSGWPEGETATGLDPPAASQSRSPSPRGPARAGEGSREAEAAAGRQPAVRVRGRPRSRCAAQNVFPLRSLLRCATPPGSADPGLPPAVRSRRTTSLPARTSPRQSKPREPLPDVPRHGRDAHAVECALLRRLDRRMLPPASLAAGPPDRSVDEVAAFVQHRCFSPVDVQ
eukprot:EG_transcript_11856